MRIVGIIIKNNKILLIRRIKNEREYYVFPGGGTEKGETEEDTLRREIKEELSLEIKKSEKIFEMQNQGNKEVYFLIENFTGKVKLGGPEKERMNKQDQYYLEWKELSKINKINNLYPKEGVIKLFEFLCKQLKNQ